MIGREIHYIAVPGRAALALAPQAEALAAAAAALVRRSSAAADAITGVVRISASEVIGAEVRPMMLAALHATHPGLTIELLSPTPRPICYDGTLISQSG